MRRTNRPSWWFHRDGDRTHCCRGCDAPKVCRYIATLPRVPVRRVRVPSPVRLLGLSFAFAPQVAAQGFGLDYRPNQREVVLDTDDTIIVPTQGVPVRVLGGVFVFRSVTIPEGVWVRATGSPPMIRIVQRDFRILGSLSVDGLAGESVSVPGKANLPISGGRAGPAGGAGGSGSPVAFARSPSGEPGFGAYRVRGLGGQPGLLDCIPGCAHGSGGGGGSFATVGDVDHLLGGLTGPEALGIGGSGCGGTLRGGQPGLRPFVDNREDNDFWGVGVDVFRRRSIQDELNSPMGGQGGGGGGSGGMIVLLGGHGIEQHVRGGTYPSSFDFLTPLSADGAPGGQ